MDQLANLRAFVASADGGSFSAAARQLGVVPSVIAKRIAQLEWQIRAPLFTRSTRKLSLTDVGERYLPTLRSLVRQVEETLAGMSRANGELEGHVRIKIPTTLGSLYLGPMLNEFLRHQPRLSMDVVLADRSVNPVEEGFDIAIGALPELYGHVLDKPLCALTRVACAAPAYLAAHGTPQHPAELREHACLVFATSGARWEFLGPQGPMGIDVSPRLKTNDGQALCQAAVHAQGIAVLADYLAAPELRSGRLVEVLPAYQVPQIWLKALVPRNRAELPRIRNLLDWLEQRFAARPPWMAETAGPSLPLTSR